MFESKTERSARFPLPPVVGYGVTVVGFASLMVFAVAQCYEMYINSYMTSWSNSMKGRLSGETPLLSSERRYSKVKVVGSGETLAERLEMERDNPWVNVRNYAGTYLPNIGVETKVIGQVALNSEIYDVILTPTPYSGHNQFWGVTYCEKIKGLVPSKPPQQKSELCAINANYLQKTDQ